MMLWVRLPRLLPSQFPGLQRFPASWKGLEGHHLVSPLDLVSLRNLRQINPRKERGNLLAH